MVDAVAFDLDGTLYHNFNFYRRIFPCLFKDLPLAFAYNAARKKLRADGTTGAFYDAQIGLVAERLGTDFGAAKKRIDKRIYAAWPLVFDRIKLFPNVMETLQIFKQNGIKLGLLSDFPLEEKLKKLKMSNFFDLELCSELSGALKPHIQPFNKLIEGLEIPPEKILYVGNSIRYDVEGSKKAGMSAALIWRKPLPPPKSAADFVFRDYRQLQRFVLG
ncbi:phosphoglycolate phosphatase [Spirochaetia bacterium]|nr:phosphoglycolate phosphatase [Spirochaetia bacterium]